MDMTKTERLLLYNQYRILAAINPDEDEFYDNAMKILEYGYKYDYDSLVEFLDDDVPEEICEEVIDILQMYRSLLTSYKELEDKSGIKKDDVKFHGFDGNDEPKHYIYAKFVIEDCNKFNESQDVELNSHWPILRKYRQMLEIWKQYERYKPLSKDEIIKILNSGK